MNVADRQVRLNRLRNVAVGERAVLSNARCLAEGVDVPTIDGVAFIDPRRSAIDVIQAVGRAVRLSAEKRLGTVVIPVVVKPDEDPEAIRSAGGCRVSRCRRRCSRPQSSARRGIGAEVGNALVAVEVPLRRLSP